MIRTPIGKLTIKRRKFWNGKTAEYFHFIDKLLGLKGKNQILPQTSEFLINQYFKIKSYRKISENSLGAISHTKVGSLIKLHDYEFKVKETTNHNGVIYLSLDSIFQKANASRKKHECKQMYAYTIDEQGRKKNAITFNFIGEKVQNVYDQIADLIDKCYGGHNKVWVMGDGAPWIRNVCNYIANSEYAIDKFHYWRFVSQALDFRKLDKDVKNRVDELMKRGYMATDKFMTEITKIAADENGELPINFLALRARIKRFHMAFKKSIANNLKCSIEQNQRHTFASFFRHRGAGFNADVLRLLANYNAAKLNKWEILQTSRKSKAAVSSVLDFYNKRVGSNVPRLDGKTDITWVMLNSIIHGK